MLYKPFDPEGTGWVELSHGELSRPPNSRLHLIPAFHRPSNVRCLRRQVSDRLITASGDLGYGGPDAARPATREYVRLA